uniref:COX assembly mitochondrial protein n=1 Tax=Glossina morsitans morsitans TaxID=37546 RepID=A0A1B0FPD7_GLOMM
MNILLETVIVDEKIMNTDLSPHLHTQDCNQLIDELKKCHEENKFAKFIGACNGFNSSVAKCLKQEHKARSAANRAKARKRKANQTS